MQKHQNTQLPVEIVKLKRQFPPEKGKTLSKSALLKLYLHSTKHPKSHVVEYLKKKPIRTLSGVTPVTVLTKPFPCPGECIFCPTDVRMPKSYIASEPGAQRAGQNGFDPYLQVYNRLQAYKEIGHPVSKVELIVLGGTWSVYPQSYQIWFISRLFTALNDFGNQIDHRDQANQIDLTAKLKPGQTYNQYISKQTNYLSTKNQTETWENLYQHQITNETSNCRCVGLVLETRPDYVTTKEMIDFRRLGTTKIQIGIQSLSDNVLKLNKRGHTVKQTQDALNLIRQAGFKIHAHWMPNLYGSNPTQDIKDYQLLFTDPNICPDELKVYPCSLIDDTELMQVYNNGLWTPYSHKELTEVLDFVLTHTPEYCRLSRIIRDIPGPEIVAGNKTTNMRQLLEKKIDPKNMHDIRSREIKQKLIDPKQLFIDDYIYQTTVSTEHFIQYIARDRQIAAFLRLSLPKFNSYINELRGHALIREVHVYGQSLGVGADSVNFAQHQGLGKQLISAAKNISKQQGFSSISVISAIGTKEYYKNLGFSKGDLYQHQDL